MSANHSAGLNDSLLSPEQRAALHDGKATYRGPLALMDATNVLREMGFPTTYETADDFDRVCAAILAADDRVRAMQPVVES